MKSGITPLPEWGPAKNKHRIEAGYSPIPGWGKIKTKKDELWQKRERDDTIEGHENKGFYDIELATTSATGSKNKGKETNQY